MKHEPTLEEQYTALSEAWRALWMAVAEALRLDKAVERLSRWLEAK